MRMEGIPLPKLNVEGSSPFSRSTYTPGGRVLRRMRRRRR